MSNSIKQGHWFYLLAALLLFMQTFALWHDVTHPFHLASTQCDQMAAVENNSTKPPTSILLPSFIAQFTELSPINYCINIERRLDDSHSIRAPPIFS